MDLQELCRKVIQARPRNSHKGSYGRVLLIGGLYPYGGAIIMAALASVNSGAGLVTVATEKDNIPALHSHLPEAMVFSFDDQALLISSLENADLVLIGPGFGENSRAEQLLDFVFYHLSSSSRYLTKNILCLVIQIRKLFYFGLKFSVKSAYKTNT
ncbi:ADP-dependent NAD(P)H-hydrate dehydratase, partial [Streptococcus suis]